MDPYLEGELWTTFHFAFGTEIVRQLAPRLRPRYAEYFIFLSRAEDRPITAVWPLELLDRLPVIPIPLLPGDADAALDLQGVFTATYDLLGYDLAIDYARPIEPPLRPSAAAQADSLLRQAGLRVA